MLYVSYISLKEKVFSVTSEKVKYQKEQGERLLKYVLEKVAGRKLFTVVKNEYGKPYLEGEEALYFNISHSGSYLVLALSDQEVGIDIEKPRKGRLKVADRFFHPEEIRHMKSLGETEAEDLFFFFWTVKEAYLKYTGQGLARSLSSFRVSKEGTEIVLEEQGERIPVYVQECLVDSGYKCHICSRQRETAKVFRLTDIGEEKIS